MVFLRILEAVSIAVKPFVRPSGEVIEGSCKLDSRPGLFDSLSD